MTTTTTTRDRGDRYGPIEWAQLNVNDALLRWKWYPHGTDSRTILFRRLLPIFRHMYHPASLGWTSVISRPFGSSWHLSFRLLAVIPLVAACSISADASPQCRHLTAEFERSHGIRTDCDIGAVRRSQYFSNRWCLQWSEIITVMLLLRLMVIFISPQSGRKK